MRALKRFLAAAFAVMAMPAAMVWDGVAWVRKLMYAPPPPSAAEEVAEDAVVEVVDGREDLANRYLPHVMSPGMHLYRAALYDECGTPPDLSHLSDRLVDWYKALDKKGRMTLLKIGAPVIDEHVSGVHVQGLLRVPSASQYEQHKVRVQEVRDRRVRDALEHKEEVSRILLEDLAAAYAKDANLETV